MLTYNDYEDEQGNARKGVKKTLEVDLGMKNRQRGGDFHWCPKMDDFVKRFCGWFGGYSHGNPHDSRYSTSKCSLIVEMFEHFKRLPHKLSIWLFILQLMRGFIVLIHFGASPSVFKWPKTTLLLRQTKILQGSLVPTHPSCSIQLCWNPTRCKNGEVRGCTSSPKVDVVIGADGANSRVAKDIEAGDYEYAIAFQEGHSMAWNPGTCPGRSVEEPADFWSFDSTGAVELWFAQGQRIRSPGQERMKIPEQKMDYYKDLKIPGWCSGKSLIEIHVVRWFYHVVPFNRIQTNFLTRISQPWWAKSAVSLVGQLRGEGRDVRGRGQGDCKWLGMERNGSPVWKNWFHQFKGDHPSQNIASICLYKISL